MSDNFYELQRRLASSSVDGFLTGNGQKPRQPAFRQSNPSLAAPKQVTSQPTKRIDDINRLRGKPTLPKSSTPDQPTQANQPTNFKNRLEQQRRGNTNQTAEQAVRPDQSLLMGASASRQNVPSEKLNKKPKKKGVIKRILKIFGILILLAVLAFGVRLFIDLAKMTNNNNPFAFLTAFQKAPLKNDNGRVNVLVAGNSVDNVGHNGASLTDSIMVLSLDTKKQTGMMLSIPRDLWVEIPGEGHSKINAAYTYGGMKTLAGVIEDDLGLPIHYTALVNYTAFKDMVNAVGGINITIKSDDPRGIYDPSLDWTSRTCCAMAKYPNGPVKLNGQQALNLARARGEGYGSYGFNADFTRTEHQRQMLFGIREKAMSSSTLSNPLKISNLVAAIGQNVETDLQLKEIQTLYSLVKDVDASKIDSYNLNYLRGEEEPMLSNYAAPGGQSALIPAAGVDNFTDIADEIQNIFNATPISKERAKVVVLNATETAGIARTQANTLKKLGMNVVVQSNATVQPTSTVIDVSRSKPASLAELKSRYKATMVDDKAMKTNYPNADLIILLGTSAVPKTTSNTN